MVHQMVAVSNAGFRAIAPDCRGYGLSQMPPDPEVENASWLDLVDDLVAILDHLDIPKVFLVGKNFGAITAYHMALLNPKRVLAVITLGVPFLNESFSLDLLHEGFYVLRWEAGRMESDFARFDVKTVIHNLYILFTESKFRAAKEDEEILDLIDPSAPLPDWFTDKDLEVYTSHYEKSGFRFAAQIPYMKWSQVETLFTDPKVEIPALEFQGMEEYVRSGKVKKYVPDLEVAFIPKGTHFVQEQFPEKVNKLIISFLCSKV